VTLPSPTGNGRSTKKFWIIRVSQNYQNFLRAYPVFRIFLGRAFFCHLSLLIVVLVFGETILAG
jgi:hypothetical protein